MVMIYDRTCRICGNSATYQNTQLCSKCEDKLDATLHKAAKGFKVAKSADFWEDYFKDNWNKDEILGAFWHLVQQNKAYLTIDRKLGFK
jgi:RecJ-like exonuclease